MILLVRSQQIYTEMFTVHCGGWMESIYGTISGSCVMGIKQYSEVWILLVNNAATVHVLCQLRKANKCNTKQST